MFPHGVEYLTLDSQLMAPTVEGVSEASMSLRDSQWDLKENNFQFVLSASSLWFKM